MFIFHPSRCPGGKLKEERTGIIFFHVVEVICGVLWEILQGVLV